MKIYQILIVALAALFIIGCGGGAATTNTTTTAPPPIASPSDTLKTFIEASKKKDVEAVKQTLSKNSLDLIKKTAEAQNVTVEELLQRGNSEMIDDAPEISNERVENETASVEIKLKTSESDRIPFVKEDGAWKIAFDKYQEAVMEKMRQEMSLPEANSSTSVGGEAQTVPPGGKPKANK